MKSLLMNKRFRTTLSGLLTLSLGLAVWWNGYYAKQVAAVHSLGEEFQSTLHRLERLETKKKALKKENLVNREKQDDLKRLSDLLVGGESALDVNTEAQKLLRTFWDKHNINLDTYREVPSGKWRDNVVVRLDYQFKCELDELAELLSFFENLEKVIRIETLNIHYLKRKEDNIQVILKLGVLSISRDEI